MSLPSVNVAIVGMGTVGSGVARVLLEHPDRLARRAGRPLHLCRAVVRDLARPRDVDLPPGLLTDDVAAVINDPSVSVAVHLVGGLEPARQIMIDLLRAGKDVVTANKALLCEHGDELFALARELGRTIAFEAAVAGGIPIIAVVGQCLAANQITSISAILNGTSNYILTQMGRESSSYDNALRSAQQLGYAEADPTLDVDGTDAAQKLVILTQLAFGMRVPTREFPRRGIDTLDLADLTYARELGYTVKLIAQSRLVGGHLEMHVLPTLVRQHSPLAETHGACNAISIVGDVVGETWYSGPGAGQMPTASAVVADLIDTVSGRTRLTYSRLALWQDNRPFPLQPVEQIASRHYLRLTVEDRPHVLADIATILGRSGISIASVIQHESKTAADQPPLLPLVIMTHRASEGQLTAVEAQISRLSSVHRPLVRLPVAD